MNAHRSRLPGLAAAVLAAVCLSAAAEDSLQLSNKWRAEVSGGAKTDGTILFRVTPKDGIPVDVTVPIRKGRGENDVARDIRDSFRKTLDSKTYSSEVDDGEDVLLKKRKGPNFELKLVESNVENVRIAVEKE